MTEETEQTASPVQGTTMDTGHLRSVIREELKAQLEDIPNRIEVEKLIERKAEIERGITKKLLDERLVPQEQRFDSLERRFDSLERLMTDMMKGLQTGLQQLTESVTNNLNHQQTAHDRLERRVAANDARLDRLEPSVSATHEAVFGGSDGTPGLRVQVVGLGVGQTSILADLASVKRMLEAEVEAKRVRAERIQSVIEMIKNPVLARFLAAAVGAISGLEIAGVL